ncbi:MAG: uracil-DNA glycosylase [Ignavibacteriales bacterium]|nr:uracil-DNA glycosylase [Ignavibacteriales bacterium]
MPKTLSSLNKKIIACRACSRLVEWREQIAEIKTKRFSDQTYWGKPIPGFGDPDAQLLLVGLAPAAHGGNRTGRMFTGDESGNWLFRALFKAGFANQPESITREDGLTLTNCYITATCRCAPPQNKLLPQEIKNCRPFILQEMQLLKNLRVIVGLGKIGFDSAFDCVKELGWTDLKSRPKFSHGVAARLNPSLTLIGTYHPSQQNTFTGKLTEKMLDAAFKKARIIL